MKRKTKLWTGLGVAVVAGALAGEPAARAESKLPIQLAQAGGEGGEGGGEGGGDTPTTYALDSTDPDAFNYQAGPQIEAYVDLVRQSYGKAASDGRALAAAIKAMLDSPSEETLKAARTAWVAARPSYLKTEAFRFYDGPIEAVEGNINAWPMNEAFIDYVEGKADAGIVNDGKLELTATAITELNQKDDEANVTTGWHAIEFLLWGQDLSAEGPGNRPYTDYVSGTAAGDRRRAYLEFVTAQLAGDLEGLSSAWEDYAPNSYAARLKTMPQREALGRMINGIAILAGFEFMSERLAVALDSGDQEDEHSCFSDTTKQDFVYDLAGIKQVWTGDSEDALRPGLDELVLAEAPESAAKVNALLAKAETRIAALGDPWDKVLASANDSPERKAAEDVVLVLQELSAALVEAGNKLGVLVLVPTE
jgi:putative iron-regulated protein